MYLDDKKVGEAPVTTTPPPEPWRQVLLDAADCLDREGWCQHTMTSAKGERCLLMALYANQWSYDPFVLCTAKEAIHRKIGMGGESLVNWNDQPGRTKEQVTAILRHVAQELPWPKARQGVVND